MVHLLTSGSIFLSLLISLICYISLLCVCLCVSLNTLLSTFLAAPGWSISTTEGRSLASSSLSFSNKTVASPPMLIRVVVVVLTHSSISVCVCVSALFISSPLGPLALPCSFWCGFFLHSQWERYYYRAWLLLLFLLHLT